MKNTLVLVFICLCLQLALVNCNHYPQPNNQTAVTAEIHTTENYMEGVSVFQLSIYSLFENQKLSDQFAGDTADGNGQSIQMKYAPKSFCIQNQSVYIPDIFNNRISVFDFNGNLQKILKLPKGAIPYYIIVLANGNTVSADPYSNTITEIDTDGNIVFKDECNPCSAYAVSGNDIFYFKNFKLFDKQKRLSAKLDFINKVPDNISIAVCNEYVAVIENCSALFRLSLATDTVQTLTIDPEIGQSSSCLMALNVGANESTLLAITPSDTAKAIASLLSLKNGHFASEQPLKLPAVELGQVIWPDNGVKWPRGFMYYFDSKSSIIYVMYTDAKLIRLSKFNYNVKGGAAGS